MSETLRQIEAAEAFDRARRIKELEAENSRLNDRAEILCAAIDHALNHPHDGLEWLRAWNEGDMEAAAELDTSKRSFADDF